MNGRTLVAWCDLQMIMRGVDLRALYYDKPERLIPW